MQADQGPFLRFQINDSDESLEKVNVVILSDTLLRVKRSFQRFLKPIQNVDISSFQRISE